MLFNHKPKIQYTPCANEPDETSEHNEMFVSRSRSALKKHPVFKITAVLILISVILFILFHSSPSSRNNIVYSLPHNPQLHMDDNVPTIIKNDSLVQSVSNFYEKEDISRIKDITFERTIYYFQDDRVHTLVMIDSESDNLYTDYNTCFIFFTEQYGTPSYSSNTSACWEFKTVEEKDYTLTMEIDSTASNMYIYICDVT